MALSGDGKTALIGGWLDENWKGSAWVFTRSGSTWSQQGPKLTGAEDEIGEGMFGTNVALSADGNTALIGGWNDDGVGLRQPRLQRQGRGLGLHSLGLDLDPAGAEAHRRRTRPETASSARSSPSPPTATRR